MSRSPSNWTPLGARLLESFALSRLLQFAWRRMRTDVTLAQLTNEVGQSGAASRLMGRAHNAGIGGRESIAGIPFLAVLLAVVLLLPSCAERPRGGNADLSTSSEGIPVRDVDGTVRVLTIEYLAKSRGKPAIFLVAAYRASEVAVSQLYADGEFPVSGELKVVYFHPNQGSQHVFESLTTPDMVRCDGCGPGVFQHLTIESFSYVFTRSNTGRTFDARLADGVVPDRFGELRYLVNGYDKDWHDNKPSAAERSEFASLYEDVLNRLMNTPAHELYGGDAASGGVVQ
jgi:hypothetical protein